MLVVGSSLDISSSDCFCSATRRARDQPVVLCVLSRFSVTSDSQATVWTLARQAPLSMGFSRQEQWRGLPCPPPGDLPDQGIKPMYFMSPPLADGFFTNSAPGKPHIGVLILWFPLFQDFFVIPYCNWLPLASPHPSSSDEKDMEFLCQSFNSSLPFLLQIPFRAKTHKNNNNNNNKTKTQEIHSVLVCFLQVLTPLQYLSVSLPGPLNTCFQHFSPELMLPSVERSACQELIPPSWRRNAFTFAFHLSPLQHLLLMQNFLLYCAMLELHLPHCLVTF